MQKTDSRRIVCTACKHENEIERVYCHNCGEKLDRSLLPQIDASKEAEEQARAKKAVKKMMNPNRMNWLRGIRTFALLMLLAAFVAAVFLAVQAPEGTPPMKTDRMPENEAGDLWAAMMNAKPAVSVTLKEYDINYYLRRAVKSSDDPVGTKFERAFVNLDTGLIKVTAQRNAWGLPLYSSVKFKPVFADGKWSTQIAGMYFGRLAVPASLGQLAPVTLTTLSKVFDKEIKQMARVSSLEPGQGVITIVTKPAQ